MGRTGQIVTALVVTGLILTAAPVGADPLTFANCYRHRVCRNDDARPKLRISWPASGSKVGRSFTIRGTASDNVKLAKVIVRVDRSRWRLATGRARWSYTIRGLSYGRHTIRVRAIDFARNKRTRNITVYVTRPTPTTTITNYVAPPATNFQDPAPPASPTGSTYGPPSVAADCSVDVSAALNSWMASIPNNSTIQFAPGACYRVETTLLLTERNTLVIDGQGALFRRFNLSPPELQWPEGNRHWRFDGGQDITIRNVRVQGTNVENPSHPGYEAPGYASYTYTMEFEHGVAFHGVRDFWAENIDVTSVWGDGLYFGPYKGVPSDRGTITDVTIDLNGRQGIALSGAQNLLFDDVSILHSRRAGFDLEPPPGFVRNIEIRNSFVSSWLLAFASSGRGDVSNIYIHHNTIDASGTPVVYVNASDGTRRFNWRVEYNNSLRPRGSPMAAMLFANVTNARILGNTWPVVTTQSRKAVEFRGATGTLDVRYNDFTGACRPYHSDALTTTVISFGNTVSNC